MKTKTTIHIHGIFLLWLAIGIIILPLKFVLAWFTAIIVHELGHLLCLFLLKIKVISISIGVSGAKIYTEKMSNMQECLVALAGPIAGLLFLPIYRYLPITTLCALFQAVFNLLPIFPLDGGRAVLNISQLIFSHDIAIKIYRYFVIGFIILLSIHICYLSNYVSSVWILMIPVMIFMIKVKFACKHSSVAVQ